MAIYKTVEKKIKLVKAAYLGPKDAGDANGNVTTLLKHIFVVVTNYLALS